MAVSNNKRKDGKRHKPKNKWQSFERGAAWLIQFYARAGVNL